jgi:hypothetical protein
VKWRGKREEERGERKSKREREGKREVDKA